MVQLAQCNQAFKAVAGITGEVQRLMKVIIGEMTIPDKPNSRLQKYRLTEKGKRFLKGEE